MNCLKNFCVASVNWEVGNIVSDDISFRFFLFVCSWDSSDSNHWHWEQALRLTLPVLCISKLIVFFLFTLFIPCSDFFFFFLLPVSILSHFWKKNWWHRREIDVMKNNWDISMSHLLCRYGHPLSSQQGSGLSVAIEGILQISQQLCEVTSQMHGWPCSLPSTTLL